MDDGKINAVALRVAGALGIFSTVFSLFWTEGDIGDSLLTGAGVAFASGLLTVIIGLLSTSALEYSQQFKNPMGQGVAFAFFVVIALGVLDLILLRGQTIIIPTMQIVTERSLQGTFWVCNNWVSVEEGSYCADE